MKTLQFEALKVALKQNKDGYVLTLCIHPDDIPDDLLRDFVGSRYQVVMVRLNEEEQPMDRENEHGGQKAIRLAGVMCREKEFWDWLYQDGQIFDATEKEATDWLRDATGVNSRSELKTNPEARKNLERINKEYMQWKTKKS